MKTLILYFKLKLIKLFSLAETSNIWLELKKVLISIFFFFFLDFGPG
jgi:hypothetical protein